MFPSRYLTALIEGARSVTPALPDIAACSDTAALLLVEGHNLYIASVRPDFVSEGYIRSGGLMMLQEYDPENLPTSDDVVIVGWTEATPSDHHLLSTLKETGCLTIGFGPDTLPTDAFFRSRHAHGDTLVSILNGSTYR